MTVTMNVGESSGGGLTSCACWEQHITLKWQKSGFLLYLLVLFMSLGLFAPYIIVLIKNMMPAFLPYISQAGGEPPTNGVFAVFMEIGAFFGIIASFLAYVTIQQRNERNLKIIRTLMPFEFFFLLMSIFGLIVTVCNPVGYTDLPNKFQYVTTVLFEHSIGATIVLVGLVIFQLIAIPIWWFLPDTSQKEKYVKIGFGCVYFIFFLVSLYPLPGYLIELLGTNPFDFESMKKLTYSMPHNYSVVYLICSVCEWSVVVLSVIHLFILAGDLQRVSCRIVFRHKSCLVEDEENKPSISLKVIQKSNNI